MTIVKDYDSIRLNLFGITLGIFNNFQNLYGFAESTGETFKNLIEDVKDSIDQNFRISQMKDALRRMDMNSPMNISLSALNNINIDKNFLIPDSAKSSARKHVSIMHNPNDRDM